MNLSLFGYSAAIGGIARRLNGRMSRCVCGCGACTHHTLIGGGCIRIYGRRIEMLFFGAKQRKSGFGSRRIEKCRQ